MSEADLQTLLDKQACLELIYTLARAVDRRDEALIRSVFHADATDDHGSFQGTATAFVDWVLPILGSMKRTQHLIGNVLIKVRGDKAAGESQFVAHHVLGGAGEADQLLIVAGRYLDRFERRRDVWGIAHRQAVYDWQSLSPSTDTWDRSNPGSRTFGGPSPDDASYSHFERLEL